jgi:putative ABC transport system ATP-binding protein
MTHPKDEIQTIATKDTVNSPLLLVEGLGRQVQNRWVWQDISFELQPGERLAVTGPSGAGKSLLLRAIANLDSIQAGQITFNGQPLTSWSMQRYRTHVIYLHQRPAIWEGTVESNLQQVYKLASHRDKRYDRQQILNYLAVLGRSADFLKRSSARATHNFESLVNTWLTENPKRAYLWTSHDPAQLERVTNRSITVSGET